MIFNEEWDKASGCVVVWFKDAGRWRCAIGGREKLMMPGWDGWGDVIDHASARQRGENASKCAKRRVAKWVVVTFMTFNGEVGGTQCMEEWRNHHRWRWGCNQGA